jgi:hypothetical protein
MASMYSILPCISLLQGPALQHHSSPPCCCRYEEYQRAKKERQGGKKKQAAGEEAAPPLEVVPRPKKNIDFKLYVSDKEDASFLLACFLVGGPPQ